jgi:hypothetical protein
MSGLVMTKVRPLMSDYSLGRRLNSVTLYISSMSKLNSFNTKFRKRFFQMPYSMNKIGRYCDQILNTLLLTHTKHQECMSIYDRSKWIWISLYPFIDYGIHTPLRPPCIECTVLTLTIIYYGCPIFLSLYETFMHDFILGYYGPFTDHTHPQRAIFFVFVFIKWAYGPYMSTHGMPLPRPSITLLPLLSLAGSTSPCLV